MAAIEEFMEPQQTDDAKLLLQAYQAQMSEFINFLNKKGKSATEHDKAIKIMKELPALRAKQQELQEVMMIQPTLDLPEAIQEEEAEEEVKEIHLSTLDQVMGELYNE
jgi:hypothetical protein